MTTIRITIEVEPAHGDDVITKWFDPGAPRAHQASPDAALDAVFSDELDPLPPEPMALPTAFRGAAHNTSPDVCPIHHQPWKVVPAGVSKRTGKAYDAFRACPEQGCTQRPAA